MSERSVATDALATLGTIITSQEKRDAIHLGVDVAAHVTDVMTGLIR